MLGSALFSFATRIRDLEHVCKHVLSCKSSQHISTKCIIHTHTDFNKKSYKIPATFSTTSVACLTRTTHCGIVVKVEEAGTHTEVTLGLSNLG